MLVNALTILAAISPIKRFEDAKHLVGYAGLGASVHDSGQMHATGHITKAGRRDLGYALAEAANDIVIHYTFWKKRVHPAQRPFYPFSSSEQYPRTAPRHLS